MTDLVWLVSSSLMILVVLVLRAVFGKRMSAGLRYALWALVLVRLLVPGTVFKSPVSVKDAVMRTEAAQNLETVKDYSSVARSGRDDMIASPRSGGSDSVIRNVAPEKLDAYKKTIEVRDVLNVVWFTGMGLMAAYLVYVNVRFYLKLRDRRSRVKCGAPCRVYAVSGIESSCLFLNTVYVSKESAEDPERLACVIAHELSHRRHGDGVFTLLRSAALVIHWYNPLVWLAAFASRQDSELFADAGAVKRLGETKREDYGRTLIELSRRPSVRASIACTATTMANNKRALKERVTNVARARRTGIIIGIAVIAISLAAVGCAFLGSARAENRELSPDPTASAEATTAPDPDACPYDEHDHAVLWAFFETSDKYGVKNGTKLFKAYDAEDPATWVRNDDNGAWETSVEWSGSGRAIAVSLVDRNKEYGEGQTLAGGLALDGFGELQSISVWGYTLLDFSAENCPKLEKVSVVTARNEAALDIDWRYSAYHVASRRQVRVSSTGNGMLEPDKANYTVEAVSDGACVVAVLAYDEDYPEVRVNAAPYEGNRFVGWYDLDTNALVSSEANFELSNGAAAGLNGEYRLIARSEPIGPVSTPEDGWFVDKAWTLLERYVELYHLPFAKEAGRVELSQYDPPESANVIFEGEEGWEAQIGFIVSESGEWIITDEGGIYLWQTVDDFFALEKRIADREFIRILDLTGTVTPEELEANGFDDSAFGAENYAATILAGQFTGCPANNLFHCEDAAFSIRPGESHGGDFNGDVLLVILKPDDLGSFSNEFGDIFGGFCQGDENGEQWGWYTIWMNVLVTRNADGSYTYSFNTAE